MGILTTMQPLRRSVTWPQADRTRVVSVQIADQWKGETGFVFTQMVGNNVRLLRVEVMLQQTDFGAHRRVDAEFQVYTATTLPVSLAQVRNLEPVLPIFGAGPRALWRSMYGSGFWEWTMNKLYTGTERRFGLLVTQLDDWRVTSFASFTISEG